MTRTHRGSASWVIAAVLAVAVVVVTVAVPDGNGLYESSNSRSGTVSFATVGRQLAASSEPTPTSTPGSPGITIAASGIDMPDPFLFSEGGRYYIYLSTSFGSSDNLPIFEGSPGHWRGPIEGMPEVPAWALPATSYYTWDPTVARIGDRYLLYAAFTVADPPPADADARSYVHCIGVETSGSPLGPFEQVGDAPLMCQSTLGGDIDADFFVDAHGPDGPVHPYYLIWKSDNNNLPGSGPTTIWAAPLSNDGLSFAGPARPIFRPSPRYPWELPVLEAPQMVLAPDGSTWLFFSSGSGYYTPRYGMGATSCASPLGPCSTTAAKKLIWSNAQGPGPGEETVFVASDASTWLLYSPYHSQITLEPIRPVEAARIGWNASGPYVAEAGKFPLPSP